MSFEDDDWGHEAACPDRKLLLQLIKMTNDDNDEWFLVVSVSIFHPCLERIRPNDGGCPKHQSPVAAAGRTTQGTHQGRY